MSMRRWGICAALMLATLGLTVSAQSRSARRVLAGSIDDGALSTVSRSTHPLAQARYEMGAVDDSLVMRNMILVLKRTSEQQAALDDLLIEQQTPNSANYHKWLTPSEFGERFSPSADDVETVKNWLVSHGFNMERVAAGGGVILFSGTAGAVRNAFHTEMRNYQVQGKPYVANARDVQLPTALADVVSGVASLNNFGHRRQSHLSKNDGRTADYYISGSSNPNGFGPGDFAKIYNSAGLLTQASPINGAGVTIAVLGRTNIDKSDATQFRSMFGLPANDPNIVLVGDDPGLIDGDEGESDLDVQWAGATAPGAKINFIVNGSTVSSDGIDLAAIYAVENVSGDVISLSYGSCEADLSTSMNSMYNSLWQQAAAEGITVLVSSGDNGSTGCDSQGTVNYALQGLAVNGLASTPYNVAVGGTDFNYGANGASTYWGTSNDNSLYLSSAVGYIPEAVWNDTCAFSATAYADAVSNCTSGNSNGLWSSAGGASSVYSKPGWQSGPGVPSDSKRDIPDVSLLSGGSLSNVYYIVCEKDANYGSTSTCDLSYSAGSDGKNYFDFHRVSGTSASAPAMAGVIALAIQSTGGRLGLVNRNLYALAKSSNGASIFHDVTVGSNAVPCKGGTGNCSASTSATNGVTISATNTLAYSAGVGYDLASGLGSINIANLLQFWNTASYTATTTTLTGNSSPATHGAKQTLTVQVSPTSATGSVAVYAQYSDGTKVAIDSATLANGAITLSNEYMPGGDYTLYARYAGDATYAPSTSAGSAMSVSRESSKTWPEILVGSTATANNVTYGSSYVMRVDVTNASGSAYSAGNLTPCGTPGYCASGAVTITDNSTAVKTMALNALGYAEYDSIVLSGGNHSLVATYSGDNGYNSSNGSLNFTVSQAATATGLTTVPTTANTGDSITLVAKVATNSNGVGPTGAVTFYYTTGSTTTAFTGTPTYTPYAYDASAGKAAYMTASLTTSAPSVAGSYTVSASYAGDTNYSASTTSVTAPMTVSGSTVYVRPWVNYQNVYTYRGGTGFTPTLTLTPLNGYTGVVNLSCSTTPSTGISCSLPSSVTITDGATPVTTPITLSATTAAAVGEVSVTITASTSNGGSATSTFLDEVASPYLQIANGAGSLRVAMGESQSETIKLSSVGGYVGATSLSCAGNVQGLTCSVSPASPSVNGSDVTVTLNASATMSTPKGLTTVTVIDSVSGATGGVLVNVDAPISVYSLGAVVDLPGATGGISAVVVPQDGFAGTVTATCASNSPANVTCSMSSSASAVSLPNVTLPVLIAIPSTATPGNYTVTVTVTTSTGYSTTLTGSVNVLTPFTLAVPSSVYSLSPTGTASTTLTVQTTKVTTGSVSVSCATNNAHLTCTPASPSLTFNGAGYPTDDITINADSTAVAGSYTATITVVGFNTTVTQVLNLTVTAPLTLTPQGGAVGGAGAITMTSNSSATSTITLTPAVSSYTGTVALSCNTSSALITCAFDKTSYSLTGGAAATATMTVTASSTAANHPEKNGMPWRTGGALLLCGLLAALPLRKRFRLSLLAIGVVAALALSGCGGGGGGNSGGGTTTTSNTYMIGVTATASTGQTTTINYGVTVSTTK